MNLLKDQISISTDPVDVELSYDTAPIQTRREKAVSMLDFDFSERSLRDTTFRTAHDHLAPEHQSWVGGKTMYIQARIVEILPDVVVMECLIDDVEPATIEEREFDRTLMPNNLALAFGTLVLIHIYQRPGQQTITFKPGEGIVKPQRFENAHLFDELAGTAVAQKGRID
jgi:hypothetical protein